MGCVLALLLLSAMQDPYILDILQAARIQPVLRLQRLLFNTH